jgi:two-component system chemotaxis response regulator CheB
MFNPDDSLQVLVVDDTAIYRKIIADVLTEIPGVEVIGTATNGRDAIEKAHFFQPDLLTLDLEMPEMGGLEVLTRLKGSDLKAGAIVISSHTDEGGAMTIKALNRGAFDFILKPENVGVNDSKEIIKKQLELIFEVFRFCRSKNKSNVKECRGANLKAIPKHRQHKSPITIPGLRRSDIIAIGVSTGGPSALGEVLPVFPADLPVPIIVAQHMPSGFTDQLAISLNKKCALDVRVAKHMELLCPGTVFIAPGGRHMKIEEGPGGIRHICITEEEPGTRHKPSIDLMFRSVAEQFGANATGVIMTGMGSDGLQGMKQMKKKGATIIAQDEESCVVYGMPAAVVMSGVADLVLSLSDMATAIIGTLKSRKDQ